MKIAKEAMKRILILVVAVLTVLICPVTQASPEALTIRISWFEINEKEVKRDFRLYLYAHGTEFAAKRTPEGFTVPDELRNEKTLDARIVLGKFNLVFNSIPISSFADEWRIGIRNKKPFPEEFDVTAKESKTIRFMYYLKIGGGQNIYTVFKNRAAEDAFNAARRQR